MRKLIVFSLATFHSALPDIKYYDLTFRAHILAYVNVVVKGIVFDNLELANFYRAFETCL